MPGRRVHVYKMKPQKTILSMALRAHFRTSIAYLGPLRLPSLVELLSLEIPEFLGELVPGS